MEATRDLQRIKIGPQVAKVAKEDAEKPRK
jgi:hypothetical protein